MAAPNPLSSESSKVIQESAKCMRQPELKAALERFASHSLDNGND